MAEYNQSFSNYLNVRTKFWLHQATYEEAYEAKHKYITLRKNILGY